MGRIANVLLTGLGICAIGLMGISFGIGTLYVLGHWPNWWAAAVVGAPLVAVMAIVISHPSTESDVQWAWWQWTIALAVIFLPMALMKLGISVLFVGDEASFGRAMGSVAGFYFTLAILGLILYSRAKRRQQDHSTSSDR